VISPDPKIPKKTNNKSLIVVDSNLELSNKKAREEMNGVIVYDSYARITGNTKIVEYFEN